MIRIISFLIFLVVLIILLSLAYVNAEPVFFDYLFASAQIPLAILLLLCFLAGALLSTISYLSVILFLKRKLKRLQSVDHQA